MLVKNVTSGEPITAFWANSVANNVNMGTGLHLQARRIHGSHMRPLQMASEPAFQVRYAKSGAITLNAGQIYFNGLLVSPTVDQCDSGTGVEGEVPSEIHSYNMFSSIKNWAQNSIHWMQDINDYPQWYIVITAPLIVNKDNIKQVKAELIKNKPGQEPPTKPEKQEGEEQKQWLCFQLTKAQQNKLLQLISGSIWIWETPISIIGQDGIIVDEDMDSNGTAIFTIKGSIIADVDIDIIGGENVTVNETIIGTTRQYTINATDNDTIISIVAGDGIVVAEKDNTYTISTIASVIHYDFDQQWFIITDGVVTINEEKINEVAEQIANSATVNINVTGIVDEILQGSVQVNTTGLTDGDSSMNAQTTVSVV